MFDSTNVLPLSAIVALAALLVVLWSDARRTDPLETLADAVIAQSQPDDLVLIDGHSMHFEVERFDPLVAIATDRIPPDAEAFARVFIVSNEAEPSSVRASVERNGVQLWTRTEGDLTATLYQAREVERPVRDLGALLPTATVEVVHEGGTAVQCPWNGERFQCADADWVYVGYTVQVIAGQPQRCIWTHPVDGAVLRVSFPDSFGATHVSGWFALTDYAIGIPDGARATMRVLAGGRERAFSAHRNRGRRRLDWSLPAGHVGPVAFEFSAERAGVRHMCWDVRLVQRASGPLT